MDDQRSKKIKRIFFVVNNKAGNADEQELRDLVEDKMTSQGIQCEYFVREAKGQSRRKATRKALDDGFQVVIAVGGDGTVSKVADELQGSDAELGVVPNGSANLIARGLQLPLDIGESLDVINERVNKRWLDGMRVGKKTYFSHISLGVYSQITKRENKAHKKVIGKLAYLWPLLKEIRQHRAWKFKIEAPEIKETLSASLVMVANVGNSGFGEMKWGEGIEPDDEHLDLCLIRGRGIGAYTELVWKAMRKHPEETSHIDFYKIGSSIRISADSNLPVRADGGLIGEHDVEIKVVKRAVPVIVPAVEKAQ
ncbi:Diacylglycerol kinase [Polystyrenella longa]|uniref:Diacylglycerol kinase n=1 Tax=Polystyrenella longa TaxID=2528007 RepID=A0A518CLA9_9PLAN|nr:diacylglycerol kinase family protein [Polystyrenella longa]QDU80013.1 Diacylglycerol kinase [Polystyrenella longa]